MLLKRVSKPTPVYIPTPVISFNISSHSSLRDDKEEFNRQLTAIKSKFPVGTMVWAHGHSSPMEVHSYHEVHFTTTRSLGNNQWRMVILKHPNSTTTTMGMSESELSHVNTAHTETKE